MNFLLDNGHEMMYNENMILVKSRRKDDPNAEWNVDQIYADGLPGGKEREEQIINNTNNRKDYEYEYKVEVK
jgi:hypothetical protein|tara:strand:- start:47 stop:262 length:216 start_codon:yes stop_codon:yes gene_type:complete